MFVCMLLARLREGLKLSINNDIVVIFLIWHDRETRMLTNIMLSVFKECRVKFEAGDSLDSEHCTALVHEFYRCQDSFKQFEFYGQQLILQGKTRERSYKAYNAYADFIHHMYEFMLGCHARDAGNTRITNKKGEERTSIIESYIMHHAKRVMNQYRDAIQRRTAPDWVNDISYYDVTVPESFAKDFREYRNKVVGHVAHERSSKLSLTNFYHKYHKFMYYMYRDSIHFWGRREEFPDLKEITDFSLMLEQKDA